jgi:hypothetical protein
MNCREVVYTQIKFELQERERRLSRLMGREQSTRPITPGRSRASRLVTWLRCARGNRTGSLGPCLDTERELQLVPVQNHKAPL